MPPLFASNSTLHCLGPFGAAPAAPAPSAAHCSCSVWTLFIRAGFLFLRFLFYRAVLGEKLVFWLIRLWLQCRYAGARGSPAKRGLKSRDENGTDIFRPYSKPNPFKGVQICSYLSPDIQHPILYPYPNPKIAYL